jgi:uncharacterized protein YgbK (DUF1537 family)
MTGALGSPCRRLAVVADDLTGAADVAAPFAHRGAEASLVLRWPPRADVDLVALVTDSRWRTGSQASALVTRMVGRARGWGAEHLFVKVDSTLRGNVRHEVRAALKAWGSAAAVATPAFPAQGRVVRDGVLLVHGEPVPGPVAARFPVGVPVLDAETDAALAEIARRIVRDGLVAVGSAGLARALAAALPDRRVNGRRVGGRRPTARVSGVLVVVGSTHPVSRAQADALVRGGAVPVVVGSPAPAGVEDAAVALARGDRVLLTTRLADDFTTRLADGVPADGAQAAAVAGEVASAVAAMVTAAPAAALVLTGGATALAVATALGATEFRVLGEVGPGIALGELVLADRRIPAVTKSGGFGAGDALVRAAEMLEACA